MNRASTGRTHSISTKDGRKIAQALTAAPRVPTSCSPRTPPASAGARGELTEREAIDEFLRRQPAVLTDDLLLNEREDRERAAERESAHLDEEDASSHRSGGVPGVTRARGAVRAWPAPNPSAPISSDPRAAAPQARRGVVDRNARAAGEQQQAPTIPTGANATASARNTASGDLRAP